MKKERREEERGVGKIFAIHTHAREATDFLLSHHSKRNVPSLIVSFVSDSRSGESSFLLSAVMAESSIP